MIRHLILFVILLSVIFLTRLEAGEIKNIKISGNERISDDTIKMFSRVEVGQIASETRLNEILKDIYDSSFFKDVSVELKTNTLIINVEENPIIENIKYDGVNAKKIISEIISTRNLKPRSSYSDYLFKNDKKIF